MSIRVAILLLLMPLAAYAQIPCFEPIAFRDFLRNLDLPDETAKSLRDKLARNLANYAEVHDQLIAVADQQPRPFVCLFEGINAFVLGGENAIFVHLPLIERMGHDKQALAGVVAHELGHIVRDHYGYRLKADSVLKKRAENTAMAEYYKTGQYFRGIEAGEKELERLKAAFSRDQERDADSYGTVLLRRAGFPPEAMIKTMTHLAAISGGAPAKWNSSHPGAFERIESVESRVQDEQSEVLARQLTTEGSRRELAKQINAWLRKLPNSGNAWYHKAVFLQKLRSPHSLEAFERSLTKDGPGISRTDDEIEGIWLALCVGLYKAGHKLESANCSRKIRDAERKEQYRAATFRETLVVGGEERAFLNVMTLRGSDGRKVITNQASTVRLNGAAEGDLQLPWKPLRFPPSGADQSLRER